jgi:FMN-dependent NADH-azoreductase
MRARILTTLLHIDTSARRQSISREVSAAFAHAWRAQQPDGDYLYRDLSTDPVPFIDRGVDRAMRCGARPRRHQTRPDRRVVVIGTPMHNYSIPAALKAWLDQVTFPRMSLAPRRFVIAAARGGAYYDGAPKAAFDYQQRYLRDFFAGHLGVTDAAFIAAELVNSRHDSALADLREDHERSYALAVETARRLGKVY